MAGFQKPCKAFLSAIPALNEEQFWQGVYVMQNGSMAGWKDWEDCPLEQWALMLKVHNAAVERQNREIEKARRRK